MNFEMNKGRKRFLELKEKKNTTHLKTLSWVTKDKIYCTGKTKEDPYKLLSWDEATEISSFQLRIEGISLKAKGALSLLLGPFEFFIDL